jgi:L-lactate dehydrogenase complex protein LldG
MTNSRDLFLQRVRRAVAEGNGAGAAPPLPERGGVGRQGAGSDPVARFCAECSGAGGFVHVVADPVAASEMVMGLLRERSVGSVLLGSGAVLDALDLPTRLRAAGVEVVAVSSPPDDGEGRRNAFFAADAGISGVDYLVAETGSIALLARPDQPRSLSLLPPLHIAVADRGQLLHDLFDLFDAQLWAERQGLPSCLSLITGPSKTGDIELRLVTGVHGPGEVHVVLLAGDTRASGVA